MGNNIWVTGVYVFYLTGDLILVSIDDEKEKITFEYNVCLDRIFQDDNRHITQSFCIHLGDL